VQETKPKIFVDANVLLDILLHRARFDDARASIERHAATHTICISSLTAHLLVYFGLRVLPLGIIEDFVRDFVVLSLESADTDWAFANCPGTDFEDALQVSVAHRNGCTEFLTLDKKLVATYKKLNISTLLKFVLL
jgi:predicted nucleic acid-binding protein